MRSSQYCVGCKERKAMAAALKPICVAQNAVFLAAD